MRNIQTQRNLGTRLRIYLLALACVGSLSAAAQTQSTSLNAESDKGLTLSTNVVAPQRFIAVHGRRALVEGFAAEGLEIWAYPFQIVRGYRVAFRPQGATSAVEGRGILSTVEYEPDSVTRIYTGSDFTVRERLFVPMNLPGAILTYSIQSGHPVDIEIHATPVLNLMWPAELVGQSISWNHDSSAFVLSESQHGYTAAFGSPDIGNHDEVRNQPLGGEGSEIGFTLHPNNSGIANLFFALNLPNASDTGAVLRSLIRDREFLQSETANHVREFRDHVLKVQTPDDRVNRAIAWAEIALDQAWVCNPDIGCGYVAGYGPSRIIRRPQYAWFFAGDGLVTAEAAISVGDTAQARDELEFILRYQDHKSGMIWHEISQSAGLIDWAGKYPYMFVHVDVTFQFLAAVGDYVEASGDIAFVRGHWQALEAAYRYCQSLIDPATLLPRIPTDKEGGNEQDRMSDDLGLSTSWVEAASAFARLARMTGHEVMANAAEHSSQSARNAIPTRYWDSNESFWISGHTPAGRPMADFRSGPSQALTMHLFNPQQNEHVLKQLASSSFQTDWGTRGLSSRSPTYSPESYATGSVWPVATGGLATAFWSEHRPITALALWNSLLTLTSMDSLGHIHEVLTGELFRPQAQSVPEQSWSTAGFLDSTVHGLLGLHIDSVKECLQFAPSIPATWNDLSIGNINIGRRSVSLVLNRSADGLMLKIENSGVPFQMDFAPNLPLGAKLIHASYDDHPVDTKIEEFPQQTRASVEIEVPHGISELSLHIAGGVSVLAEDYVPIPGHSSAGIRIVEVHLTGAQLTIEADVPTGRASRLKLQTAWKLKDSGNSVSRQTAPNLFELSFAPDSNAHAPYRRARATLNFDR